MRARHAALVEHSADAIVAVDLDGRITAWNHAATALYGFTEREALGEMAERLVPSTSGDGTAAERDGAARSCGARRRAGAATARRSRSRARSRRSATAPGA